MLGMAKTKPKTEIAKIRGKTLNFTARNKSVNSAPKCLTLSPQFATKFGNGKCPTKTHLQTPKKLITGRRGRSEKNSG